MSLLYSPAATATVAANTNSVAISGMDLATVLPGMVINLGARDRVAGDGYIIATVVPTGSSGGTLTTVGAIPTAFTSAGFVIDTRDFNGTAPNYLIASYTQVLNALLRLTSPLTNLFTGSRQVALDKDSSPAVSRLLYAIAGRAWGALEQRTITVYPTGAPQFFTEALSLRAYPDGTTPVDVLTIDLATGGGDLRKVSTILASATTVELGGVPSGKVAITGNVTIVSFGAGKHLERLVHFVDGGATLTHNPTSLVLPGGANIITAAGDCLHTTSDGSSNWRVRSYARASGRPLIGPVASDLGLGSTNSVTHASVNVTASFMLGGLNVIAPIGDYRAIYTKDGIAALTLGHAADQQNYISGSALTVRSRDAATTFATIGTTSTFSGPINAPNFNASTAFQLGGANILVSAGGAYRAFVVSGTQIITAGDSSDASTYYSNTTHHFRSRDYSVTFATLSAIGFSLRVPATLASTLQLAPYTIGTLPAGAAGMTVYASNARKVGEAAGSGTGVIAYYSNGNWRRLSDDTPVAA